MPDELEPVDYDYARFANSQQQSIGGFARYCVIDSSPQLTSLESLSLVGFRFNVAETRAFSNIFHSAGCKIRSLTLSSCKFEDFDMFFNAMREYAHLEHFKADGQTFFHVLDFPEILAVTRSRFVSLELGNNDIFAYLLPEIVTEVICAGLQQPRLERLRVGDDGWLTVSVSKRERELTLLNEILPVLRKNPSICDVAESNALANIKSNEVRNEILAILARNKLLAKTKESFDQFDKLSKALCPRIISRLGRHPHGNSLWSRVARGFGPSYPSNEATVVYYFLQRYVYAQDFLFCKQMKPRRLLRIGWKDILGCVAMVCLARFVYMAHCSQK